LSRQHVFRRPVDDPAGRQAQRLDRRAADRAQPAAMIDHDDPRNIVGDDPIEQLLQPLGLALRGKHLHAPRSDFDRHGDQRQGGELDLARGGVDDPRKARLNGHRADLDQRRRQSVAADQRQPAQPQRKHQAADHQDRQRDQCRGQAGPVQIAMQGKAFGGQRLQQGARNHAVARGKEEIAQLDRRSPDDDRLSRDLRAAHLAAQQVDHRDARNRRGVDAEVDRKGALAVQRGAAHQSGQRRHAR
jgi:hypothetical protein